MKTFSDEALAALERGDAIVSASVEIIPSSAVSYGTASALNVAATTFGGTLSDRTTTFSGYSATDIFRVSKPAIANDARLTWDGWSAWATDGSTTPLPPPVTGQTWNNLFSVYGNNGGSDTLLYTPALDSNLYATEADAFAAIAALLPRTLTGYANYKIVVPFDNNPSDNRHGLSLLVGKGVPLGSGDPIRLWGGLGNFDLPSDAGTSTFRGLGDRGLGNQTTASIGGTAQNLTLSLSGIEPAALDVLDASEIKNSSVVVRRLIFDSAGKTLLGSYVYTRGRVDELKTSEVIGGAASIQISIEGAARGLGRRGGRLRSDADQRLVNANDGFYRVVSAAPEKTLYWGGKKPAVAGSSVGGGGVASGNVGGGGALLGLNSSR